MVAALQQEISLQRDFFGSSRTNIRSVYFGGGTPSILTPEELHAIWDTITAHFYVLPDAEITLEANPDDMDDAFYEMIRHSPVNRLSIGIQSFDNLDLAYLNRVHDASRAISAIEHALNTGIEKISSDLIFGIPTSGIPRLEKDCRILADIGVEHISAYGLTVEPDTALAHLIRKKKSFPVNEEKAAEEMDWLMHFLPCLGFEQYETSNYALPGAEAIHNSSYWHDIPYLGIGPSAHSYKNPVRSWNVSNNMAYIRSIMAGNIPSEAEILDATTRYNEWIMTRIRLREGIHFPTLEREFGASVSKHFILAIEPYIRTGETLYLDDHFRLSTRGKLITDTITTDLFL